MNISNWLRWPIIPVRRMGAFESLLLSVFVIDCATKWIVQAHTHERIVFWGGRLLFTPPFFNRGAVRIPEAAGAPYKLYLLIGCTAVTLAFVCAWYRWPNRWTWITVAALVLFEGATIAEAMHAHQWMWVRAGMIGRLGAMFALSWDWYRQTARDGWQTMAALGLLAGGMLGNLWDVLRWDGGVPDFIILRFGIFYQGPFNVADVGIVLGGLWLMWQVVHRPPIITAR